MLGDTVITKGKVRVDIGVDFKKLNEEDIPIDHKEKTIAINIPIAEILDSSLFGEIKVKNKKEVWTNIRDFFLEDDNEEYNKAIKEIVTQAETNAMKQIELFQEARIDTKKLIELIVGDILERYEVNIL